MTARLSKNVRAAYPNLSVGRVVVASAPSSVQFQSLEKVGKGMLEAAVQVALRGIRKLAETCIA
eukprot:3050328-Amphidinium_carterae.1